MYKKIIALSVIAVGITALLATQKAQSSAPSPEVFFKEKFGNNQNLLKAGNQYYQAFRTSINPDLSVQEKLKILESGRLCFYAVSDLEGFDDSYDFILEMEDVAFPSRSDQRKYLKYNAALSGGVYTSKDADTKYCEFELAK